MSFVEFLEAISRIADLACPFFFDVFLKVYIKIKINEGILKIHEKIIYNEIRILIM